jgi:hypothetical protein
LRDGARRVRLSLQKYFAAPLSYCPGGAACTERKNRNWKIAKIEIVKSLDRKKSKSKKCFQLREMFFVSLRQFIEIGAQVAELS